MTAEAERINEIVTRAIEDLKSLGVADPVFADRAGTPMPFSKRAELRRADDEIERLKAINADLRSTLDCAMTIITNAIMHGMPITKEVADVRNKIVCGRTAMAEGLARKEVGV